MKKWELVKYNSANKWFRFNLHVVHVSFLASWLTGLFSWKSKKEKCVIRKWVDILPQWVRALQRELKTWRFKNWSRQMIPRKLGRAPRSVMCLWPGSEKVHETVQRLPQPELLGGGGRASEREPSCREGRVTWASGPEITLYRNAGEFFLSFHFHCF